MAAAMIRQRLSPSPSPSILPDELMRELEAIPGANGTYPHSPQFISALSVNEPHFPFLPGVRNDASAQFVAADIDVRSKKLLGKHSIPPSQTSSLYGSTSELRNKKIRKNILEGVGAWANELPVVRANTESVLSEDCSVNHKSPLEMFGQRRCLCHAISKFKLSTTLSSYPFVLSLRINRNLFRYPNRG